MTPYRSRRPGGVNALLVSTLLAGLVSLASGCRLPDLPAGSGRDAGQTHAPGHVTSGGGTSGTVIALAAAKASASAPAKDMGAASREAGTPGIPQGAGGNTSGTQLGGTTGNSALGNSGEQTAAQRTPGQRAPAHAADPASGAATAAGNAASGAVAVAAPGPNPASATAAAAPPPSPASAAAAAAAEQKRLLDERMTVVAQRWKQRAAASAGSR